MDLARRITRWPVLRAIRARVSAAITSADKLLARNSAWALACFALFALQATLIVTHQPWLDEYQAVQIAIQAPDIPTLLDWLRYEGHPPLWYLILRGLGHLMDPLATLPAAALILAAITQAAILFASPFTRAERLLIATSEFVLFDFLTLSRSITLGVATIMVALALWRSRWSWLAIAMLPMCDFLFGVISGILVLLKWRERQLFWPGVVLWLAIGLLAAWSVIPAPDVIPAIEGDGVVRDAVFWLNSIGTLAIPFQGGILPAWDKPVFPLASFLWIAFLWFVWAQTRDRPFSRLILFGFIGLTLGFSLVVYRLPLRYLMLIALLVIVLAWLRRMEGGRPSSGFRLWLGIASLCGLATAMINLAIPFDTTRRAAAEIRRLGLEDKHWMVYPISRAQGVSAILGIDFEQTERHCMQSLIRWNYRSSLRKPQSFARYLRDEIARRGRFYLLSDIRMRAQDQTLLRPIAAIDAGYDGQNFYLYEVGAGHPDAHPNLPPCVPGRRPFARLR